MPGRARLGRHHDHAGRRPGAASPAAPSCTTTGPSRRCSSPRSSTWPSGAARSCGPRPPRCRPDGDRVEATIDLLASLFTGPLFAAAIEVWVAARTDPALRSALVPVEARFGREVHRLTVELLGADESRPGVREAVQTTLDLMRGLGVASLLTDDSARRTRLLADWTTHLRGVLR